MPNDIVYKANGKLLLTGEYLVMYGAKAIAFPVNFGQELLVNKMKDKGSLYWQAYQPDGLWFEARFSLLSFEVLETNSQERAQFLKNLLVQTRGLNESFLFDNLNSGIKVSTKTNFPINWGLGTSSTLISLVAQWAGLNPFKLHQLVSKGSAYDIACAISNSPLLYRRTPDKDPEIQQLSFNKNFVDNLYFIYLGNKKSTENHISDFLSKHSDFSKEVEQINRITERIIDVVSFDLFIELLKEHEALIASILKIKPIQESRFSDFKGCIKSLGAWGGDFILAASDESAAYVNQYFEQNGLSDIVLFNKMIRQ